MIELKDVYMRYPVPRGYKEHLLKAFRKKERKTALSGIDLKIETGDRVALLGANGAGKTTLLKLIGGLLYPSQGTVTVNGLDTISENVKARQAVGFVINEERSFYWRLSGFENLRFFGELDNLHGSDLSDRINALLTLVGMDKYANMQVAGYSSGMKQKLAISRGLLADPDILILDEPTRALDPVSAREIRSIIQEKLHEQAGKTLLIATHNLEEAVALCNKVCFVAAGRIQIYTGMEQVLERFGTLDAFYMNTNTKVQPVNVIS